jgi:hypothetical protein
VKPRDFTFPEFVVEGREEEVYRTISEGAAQAFHGGSLSSQQIRDVVAHRDLPYADALSGLRPNDSSSHSLD